MSRRKVPGIVKIAMLVFLIYAAFTIVNLRSQIADKQEELDSLSLRVQEYEESQCSLAGGNAERDLSRGYQRAGAQ